MPDNNTTCALPRACRCNGWRPRSNFTGVLMTVNYIACVLGVWFTQLKCALQNKTDPQPKLYFFNQLIKNTYSFLFIMNYTWVLYCVTERFSACPALSNHLAELVGFVLWVWLKVDQLPRIRVWCFMADLLINSFSIYQNVLPEVEQTFYTFTPNFMTW